jgi:hypothetical protein
MICGSVGKGIWVSATVSWSTGPMTNPASWIAVRMSRKWQPPTSNGVARGVVRGKAVGHPVDDLDRNPGALGMGLGDGAQMRFGFDGDHFCDGLGVVPEVELVARADLDHPAGQAVEQGTAIGADNADRRPDRRSHAVRPLVFRCPGHLPASPAQGGRALLRVLSQRRLLIREMGGLRLSSALAGLM